jgi:hypothetical protein
MWNLAQHFFSGRIWYVISNQKPESRQVDEMELVEVEPWATFVDWLLGQENLPLLGWMMTVCRSFGDLVTKRTPYSQLLPLIRGHWKPVINCCAFPDYERGSRTDSNNYHEWAVAHDDNLVALAEFRWESTEGDVWLLSRPGHWSHGGPITKLWHRKVPLLSLIGADRECFLWVQLLPGPNVCVIAARGQVTKRHLYITTRTVLLLDSEGELVGRDVVNPPPWEREIERAPLLPRITDGLLELAAEKARLPPPLDHLTVPPPNFGYYRYPIYNSANGLRLPGGSEWTFSGSLCYHTRPFRSPYCLTKPRGAGVVLSRGPHPLLPSLLVFESLKLLEPTPTPSQLFYLHDSPALPPYQPNTKVRLVRCRPAQFPVELTVTAEDIGVVCEAQVYSTWTLLQLNGQTGWVYNDSLARPEEMPLSGRVDKNYQPQLKDEIGLLAGGQVKVVSFGHRHGRWLVQWRGGEGKVPPGWITIKPHPILLDH